MFKLLLLLALLSVASYAQLADGGQAFHLRNKATGKYLSNYFNLLGASATAPDDDQRWLEAVQGDGTYIITTKGLSGFVLDSNSNQQAYSSSANGGAFQHWKVEDKGESCYAFQNFATSLWLDSNADGAVYTLAGNGGDNQSWCMEVG